MPSVRVHLIIEGRVQGVWFRESTRRQALRMGVTGWVRNRPDGTVEVAAEGEESRVRALVDWCGEGPPAARVTRVQQRPAEWRGEFDAFEIVY